jgi:hypothetical protein
MSMMHGMDVSDVRQRAAILNAQASELARVEATILNTFSGSTWRGPDADATLRRLHDVVRPALGTVQQFLEETALLMVRNAAEQEAASA